MCATLYLRAETDDGKPHPGFPGVIEVDSYPDLENGLPMCLCGRELDTPEGEAARKAIMDAMMPLLKAVGWGNIVIEVR